MKVVIDIDETDYKLLKNECIVPIKIDTHIYEAIRNGTVLPEEHGDLIDRKALKEVLKENEWITNTDGGGLEDIIDTAPTVIPADKENENG
jgi:hypothetical protein